MIKDCRKICPVCGYDDLQKKVDILLMKYAHVAVLNLDMTTKQLDFLILLLERNVLPVDFGGLERRSNQITGIDR